jgi:hypothetical protein
MTGEEKRAWIHGSTSVVAYLSYLAVVLLTDTGYVAAMLWCIGAGIAGTLLLYAVIAARGPREPRDERDREIEHFGEYVGRAAIGLGGVTALVLALVEADHLWIANALYLGFVLSALLEAMARLAAYRHGLPGQHAW